MKYIVGAYSQLPAGSSKDEYEALLATQLKPLLTMIYRNSEYKLLFRLSISEYEYLEQYHPEVNMLINDLCRKGQMEILTSSYYDVVLSLIPAHERASQIEKTTTYIRKRFTKKPKGLWIYGQVFNSTSVPVLGLCGLSYMVMSTYNQITGIVESTRPFYTNLMGREALVFPIDDRYSRCVSDLYKGNLTLDRFLSDISKYQKDSQGAIGTIMLNLDQMMGTPGSSDAFNNLYSSIGANCTLPSIYLEDNEITKTHYIPGGVYGRDFSIGKSTSINQLIFDDPKLSRNYGLVNMLKDVVRENKKTIEDRKNLDNLLMKASSSSPYFPDECRTPAIARSCNRHVCEAETLLARMENTPLPLENDIDFDRCDEFIVIGRSNIAHLNKKGAVLSSLIISSALHDIAFNNGNGMFVDMFMDDSTKKLTKLGSKCYDVTALDKRRCDYFAKAPSIMLDKKPVNITKRYKFRQNTVVLEIEIENLAEESLSGFTYINTLDISFPSRCEASCTEGTLEDGKSVNTHSILLTDRSCPFSISLVFGQETTVQKNDFEQKARTWLGDKSFYDYTQIRIQKKLSLGPWETERLTIGFRTEKRKEKHNDTSEQSPA